MMSTVNMRRMIASTIHQGRQQTGGNIELELARQCIKNPDGLVKENGDSNEISGRTCHRGSSTAVTSEKHETGKMIMGTICPPFLEGAVVETGQKQMKAGTIRSQPTRRTHGS